MKISVYISFSKIYCDRQILTILEILRIDFVSDSSTNSSGVFVCLHKLHWLERVEEHATPCSVKAYKRSG